MAKSVRPKSTQDVPARFGPTDVAIVALGASIAGIMNDFANDDIEIIVRNARVHDLTHLRDWFTLPYWPPPFSPDLYRPVTSMLLAIEYTLGGGSPIVFRLVSYALYALACVFVFLLCTRVLPRPFAMAAAALFAAHPVHVEAVALGAGQAELVTCILALAMCVFYIDHRRAGTVGTREWVWLAVMYLVAALTKEQGLITPALLIAAEFTLVSPTSPAISRWRVVLTGGAFLLPVAALAVAMRVAVLGGLAGTFQAEALVGVSLGGRALTMLAMVPRWTRLLLWPQHLQADYSPQEVVASAGFGAEELAGSLIIAAVAYGAWRLRKRAPAFSFGVAWCALALFPVSNVLVVTGVVLAERTLFLPSVGVVLAIAALGDWALKQRDVPAHATRVLAGVTMALVLLGVARSIERQRVWRSDPFVIARTIKDAPTSFRNQRAFGDLMFQMDQPKLGHEAFANAIRYAPAQTAWRVRNSYARTLVQRGDVSAAAEQFRLSLAQRPDQEFERGEYCAVLLVLGRYGDAAAQADTGAVHTATPTAFRQMRAIADSAARVNAPAGTIRLGLVRGNVRADR